MALLPEHLSKAAVGRERLSRQVIEAHQREHILDAAVAIFAKRGYQGTTVDHLVAAAKIGVGSFYALFDGKEDCFLQAYDRIVSAASDQLAATLPGDVPWPERVCAFLRASLALIAAEPLRARVVLVEVQTAGSPALARYQATIDGLIAHLRHGRALSSRAAELPTTLEEATVLGLAWLLHQRLVVGEVEEIEELFPDFAEILLEPYLGEADTKRLIAASIAASSPRA
ncbi:MAG TPA: helix-turn-helix domain-containing protein [Solirubrobacterales bacterium]|nr:helix-turn-helix domain-containing protein [Solirubrobacterales bacterium]